MKKRALYTSIFFLCFGLLVGCGQTGDLYLPDTDESQLSEMSE